MEDLKKCKHCQTDIPKKAKICPNCKKKQGGKTKWIIIGVIVVLLIGAGSSSSNDSPEKSNNASVQKSSSNSSTDNSSKPTETTEPIEYEYVTVDDMKALLNENALKAKDTYNNKYLAITGRLSNIDSNGKYIDVLAQNEQFAIVGVQCYIKDDNVKSKVMDLKIDDIITVKVKITDVGEVLGYSANIIDIE